MAASLCSSCFCKSNNHPQPPKGSFLISFDFTVEHHIPNILTVFIMYELVNRIILSQLQFEIQPSSAIPLLRTTAQKSHQHSQLGCTFEILQHMKTYYKDRIFAPDLVHRILLSQTLRAS